MGVLIGLDIGQKRDPTALAIADPEEREGEGRKVWHFNIRMLERLPLGTPFPDVATRVAEVCKRAEELRGPGSELFVDATGVGAPVVELIAAEDVEARIIPVYFTYGDRRKRKPNGEVSLGKSYLVSRLQALLQQGRVHLPKGHPEAPAIVDELLHYEIKVDTDANEKYGAFAVGKHDDLVTALGLAVQIDPGGAGAKYAPIPAGVALVGGVNTGRYRGGE